MWDSVLDWIHSTSMCARHALMQFKVVHRIHISKTKLACMFPDVDSTCDSCKSAHASLFHMYWTCPTLNEFWISVFQTISEVLHHQIETNPFTAIFGIAPNLGLPKVKLKVLAFTSLLARRAILLNWKDPAPPSHSHWIRDIMSCMNLEKIRYTTQGSENKFDKIWHPFLTFFEKPTATISE